MLTIRNQQMAALEAPFESEFVDRVRAFLLDRTPELAATAGPNLDRRITEGRSDAAALGIETEQETALYIVLSLLHGADFTRRQPWAAVVEQYRHAGRGSGLAISLMDASKRTSART